MSRVFAFVPYTAAFTPALLKYRAKIERSMITNPTCVKMRNFSAAYRRFGAPPKPNKKKNRGMKRSPKKAERKRAGGTKKANRVNSREKEKAKEAPRRGPPSPVEKN